ncbi:MAG: DUF6265 family protein [Chitinophagaceae bacterium]
MKIQHFRLTVTKTALLFLLMTGSWILGFAQHTTVSIKQFSWLAGKWKNTERNSFEYWKFSEDSSQLTGYSFSVKEGDTTITEKLQFVCEGPTCYYIADVPDNGKPIRFAMMQHTPNGFRSENQQHDYPKYIEYKLEGPGKLRAEVGDATRKQVFTFERQEMP